MWCIQKTAKRKLKLFVWEDVLTDYTSGAMVATGRNVEEARKAILEKCNYVDKADLALEPKEVDLTEPWALVQWGGS